MTCAGFIADVACRVDLRRALSFWPHLLAVAFLNVGYHRAGFADRDRHALYQRFLRDPIGASLSDPFTAVRLHHVRDGDEMLYLNWARYMLGKPADAALLRELGDEKIDLLPYRPEGAPLLPYRDFLFQYPPLAVLPILGAAAITTDPVAYPYAFAALAALAALILAAAGLALHARIAPSESHRSHLWLSALALFLVGVTLETRLDVFAAAAVAVALWAAASGRWILAGALLGAGAALKLYPAFLVPAFVAPLLFDRRRREAAMCFGAFAGAVFLACLPAVIASSSGVLQALRIHATRGLQIESVAASVLAWLRTTRGESLDVVRAFGARDLSGGAAPALATVCRMLVPLAALAGGILPAGQTGVDRPRRIVEGVAAALAGMWIASPVLSPQYLIWGLPAFLVVRSRAARTLFLVALALTRIEYPACYPWVARLTPPALALLVVRNALLVATAGALWRGRRWKAA